jgi:hypothetical protein
MNKLEAIVAAFSICGQSNEGSAAGAAKAPPMRRATAKAMLRARFIGQTLFIPVALTRQ